jgi:hypothetical protein
MESIAEQGAKNMEQVASSFSSVRLAMAYYFLLLLVCTTPSSSIHLRPSTHYVITTFKSCCSPMEFLLGILLLYYERMIATGPRLLLYPS